MNKRFVPNYTAKNIFEISINFYVSLGIKYILCDLDNTLDSYRLFKPSTRVIKWKEQIASNGIEIIIISNNKGKRVKEYANNLKVRYCSSTRKPFTYKFRKFLKNNNIEPSKCVLIGDQLLTDMICGNKMNILTILTEPIVKEDQWTTRFNRLLDRPLRKRLKRSQKLQSWEVIK